MPLQLQGERKRIQRGDKERLPPLTVSQKQKLEKESSHFQNVDTKNWLFLIVWKTKWANSGFQKV